MYYHEIQCLSGLIAFCVKSTLAFSALFYSKTVGSLLVTCRPSVGGLSADSQLRGAVLHNYPFVGKFRRGRAF